MSKKQKKKKIRIIILILSCIVSVLAGLFTGFLVSTLLSRNHDNSNTSDTLYDIRSEEIADDEKMSDDTIIPCWDSITMTANQKNQVVNFYNPARNNGVYFQLVLSLDDGTELYSSERIPPGKALYDITLDKTLAAGKYNAKLQYNCSTYEGKDLNGSTLQFTLIMEDKSND